VLFNLAGVRRIQGDLGESKKMYEQSFAIARETQSSNHDGSSGTREKFLLQKRFGSGEKIGGRILDRTSWVSLISLSKRVWRRVKFN